MSLNKNTANGDDYNNNNHQMMIANTTRQTKGKNYPSFTIIFRRKLPIIVTDPSNTQDKNDNKFQATDKREDEIKNILQKESIIDRKNLIDFEFSEPWQIWLLHENTEYSQGDWNVKRFGPSTNTAQKFWPVYMKLYNVFDKKNFLLMIFRESIEPKWEDKCNVGGGRWFFDVSFNPSNHHYSDILIQSNCWTQSMQTVMSRCLGPLDDLIVGMILNFKSNKYRISLWVRNCINFDQIIQLGKALQKYLNLRCQIKFELHTGTINIFNGLTIDCSAMERK